jgi:hypothetical protein
MIEIFARSGKSKMRAETVIGQVESETLAPGC